MTFVAILVAVLVFGPLLILVPGILFLCAVGLFSAEPPFRVRQRFECPVRGRAVTADFAVPQGAGQPASVVYCSAFSDPTRVTCAQRCLDAATVRWAPPVGVFAGWALTSGGVVGANGSAAQVAGRAAE
jgi:hypothetical protein